MKRTSLYLLGMVALCAGMTACSSSVSNNTQSKENMLVTAGFKSVKPKNDTQQQKLQNLPQDKVVQIQKSGRTYYVFPDAARNQAFVGGPSEFEAYKQLRAVTNGNNAAVVSNGYQNSVVVVRGGYGDFAGYGGWGAGWGAMGMPMRVGPAGRF